MNSILYILIILLVSCSHLEKKPSLIYKPDPNIKIDPNKTLSKNEISEDLNFLKYTLQNAYSGYFFKNKESIEAGLAKLFKITRSIKTAKNLCELIAKSFEHVRDRHLYFKILGKPCGPQYEPTSNVGLRKFSNLNKTWTIDKIRKKKKDILLITISHFPSWSSPKWNGIFNKVKKHINEVDFVILDMRGNTGGDDTKGYQLARSLTGWKDVVKPYSDMYKIITKPGLEARWNYFILAKEHANSKAELETFQNYIDKENLKYSGSTKNIVNLNPKPIPIMRHQLLRPVYILQDYNCVSSCESTIDFFEYLSPVYRVGESTGGYIHFGNIGFVLLPNSLIQVNIASTFKNYRDSRFLETTGIKPDIKVEKGNDAFNAAIHHFNSTTK